MQGQAIATAADLPKLVGYQQLRELYGWPKRTVQEWIKARKFPKPLDLPGRGNYWTLEDIVVWMKGDLTRVAVTKPEDLKPDQLGDAAVDLLTRALEHELGEPVDPAGIRVPMVYHRRPCQRNSLLRPRPKRPPSFSSASRDSMRPARQS